MVTAAPSWAKRMAMALPIPVAAPVTMATFPCRRMAYFFPLSLPCWSSTHVMRSLGCVGLQNGGDSPYQELKADNHERGREKWNRHSTALNAPFVGDQVDIVVPI